MKQWTYVPILSLIAGELSIFNGDIFSGLGIHIINLLAIIFIIIFGNLELDAKNVLQGLILVTLLRIINLSMPQFFTTTLLQYFLMYGVMFIAIYHTLKNQRISPEELGINFNELHIYLPMAVIIGAIMASIEYIIIKPEALVDSTLLSNIILMSIVMIVFVGTIEEIIFRSIVQTRLEKVFDLRYGIVLSGTIFGIMHSTYGMVNELIFATTFGIVLGYIFQKTKSLPFIISISGIENIMLFGILPLLR